MLGHLSRDCNSPELALGAVRARLDAAGARDAVKVFCATQREVSPRFPVGGEPSAARAVASHVPESLFELEPLL